MILDSSIETDPSLFYVKTSDILFYYINLLNLNLQINIFN
jgi:hypothetical protein